MRSVENLQFTKTFAQNSLHNTEMDCTVFPYMYEQCTYLYIRDPIYVNLLSNPFKSCQSNSCPNTALHWCQQ